MPYVIGVDTGGTFTDGFVADHLGHLSSAKSPSTPPQFSIGVLNVIDELAKSLGVTTRDFLHGTSYIIHGTTSTLNALITGDVCKVGFLTTKGHANSISIMNAEGRYAGLDADQNSKHVAYQQATAACAEGLGRRNQRAFRLQGRNDRSP